MERAFRPGDPVLEIAGATTSRAEARHRQVDERDSEYQLEVALRPEQARLDAIATGAERGRYYLLTGEKGTGKVFYVVGGDA
jgi:hypothetical protein